MVAVTILVVWIAAIDSLNPSTVLPAFVFGLADNGPRRILLFASGVFTVSFAGGIALIFGLGRTLLTRVAHPSAHVRHLSELVAGVVLIAVAALLWATRRRLRARLDRRRQTSGRSAFALGAGIMAVELPTAFPYFAALVAAVETVRSAAGEVALAVVYNVVFVVPLLLIGALAARGRGRVARLSAAVDRIGPTVLPIGVACVGIVLTAVGATRLTLERSSAVNPRPMAEKHRLDPR
jgi:cytochrome c biogenesis protein CcdA